MYICLESDDSYDDDLESVISLKILPHIGYDFFSSIPKTLILGESRYWDKNEIIKDNIRDHFDYYGNSVKDNGTAPIELRPFRNTVAMITGKGYHHSDDEWRKLAYHVFFQGIVGNTPEDKSKITRELIEQSQEAYIDVIKILKPQLIIVWGIDRLYKEWIPLKNRKIIDKEKRVYKYIEFPDTIIWHIKHPSRGFSWEDWHNEYLTVKSKYFNQSKE
jgi:hypothetical protein